MEAACLEEEFEEELQRVFGDLGEEEMTLLKQCTTTHFTHINDHFHGNYVYVKTSDRGGLIWRSKIGNLTI